MLKPRRMPKMQAAGRYRPPRLDLPGAYNLPRPGRVGKSMPAFKRLTKRR